jgi:hypothetical protein
VATLHWGCNADFQHVLTNNLIYDQIISLDIPYHNFAERQLKLDLFGLEKCRAVDNLIEYVTSYIINGNKSSANWTQIMKSIANDMCQGEKKSPRSVSYKFLVEIGKARSISHDEACFLLAGGQLSYNTFPVYKCSVPSIDQADFPDTAVSCHNNFKWYNIVRKYKERDASMFQLSLCFFVANHCVKKHGSFVQVVPQFFGYESKLPWPLEEEYSKWDLILYQSWLGVIKL